MIFRIRHTRRYQYVPVPAEAALYQDPEGNQLISWQAWRLRPSRYFYSDGHGKLWHELEPTGDGHFLHPHMPCLLQITQANLWSPLCLGDFGVFECRAWTPAPTTIRVGLCTKLANDRWLAGKQ